MSDPVPPPDTPPPRAFTQGVGTVFQFAGVSLFLCSMILCCGSGLLGKDYATRADRTQIGWRFGLPAESKPVYTEQKAITVSVMLAVFFGMALAGIGLGLQAQRRGAPLAAVITTAAAALFWSVQCAFAIGAMRSMIFALLFGTLAVAFVALLLLSVTALREMRRDPPPAGHEVLPPDYRVPYSHQHQDPPEVRLAHELEQRRQRLAVQQKELEMLEERIRKHPKDKNG